jgi:hypothetical protein
MASDALAAFDIGKVSFVNIILFFSCRYYALAASLNSLSINEA